MQRSVSSFRCDQTLETFHLRTCDFMWFFFIDRICNGLQWLNMHKI